MTNGVDGRPVLIVGAGIAGLTAAILLARAGAAVTLVERDREMRGGGFLVSLSHAAYACAGRLGILDALAARTHGIRRSSYHGPDGRTLLRLDYGRLFDGLDVIQPMRNDLARALLERLPDGVDLRRGERVAALTQDSGGVDATFAGGGGGRFHAVIGADGVHSAVRRLAFPETAVRAHPLGLFCAAYRMPDVLGLERAFQTHMERERYMAVFSTAPEEIGGVFVWATDRTRVPETGAERAALLRAAFTDCAPSTATALTCCPTDRLFYMDRLQQIEMSAWHRGRVALVGDAAHCMTLFSGRGAASAMVGAAALADALAAHGDPETAFAAHTAASKPKIDRIQAETRRAVRWYVPRRRPIQLMRDTGLRVLPDRLFERHFQAKYSRV